MPTNIYTQINSNNNSDESNGDEDNMAWYSLLFLILAGTRYFGLN